MRATLKGKWNIDCFDASSGNWNLTRVEWQLWVYSVEKHIVETASSDCVFLSRVFR